MRKVILALLFSLVITPVFGKIITMNGEQYQAVLNEDTGEYILKKVGNSSKDFGKPKVSKLNNTIENARSVLREAISKVESLEDENQLNYSVLDRKPVKSNIVEKIESESSYVEQICDNPMGCRQDVKSGHCPDCKNVQIFEQKIVQKTPEKKVFHKKVKDISFIKEGSYSLRKIHTIMGVDQRELYFSEGFSFYYKKLSRNEYYVKIGGSTTYNMDNEIKVVACPIPTVRIIKLNDKGKVIKKTELDGGSCPGLYKTDTSFGYDDLGNLKKINKRLNSACVTDHCNDKGAIDIFTLVYEG